jgi:hypothetical protein
MDDVGATLEGCGCLLMWIIGLAIAAAILVG